MSFGFGFSIVATRGLSLAQRAIALLLEDGSGFLTMETGDLLLLE